MNLGHVVTEGVSHLPVIGLYTAGGVHTIGVIIGEVTSAGNVMFALYT
jgi:hypothetical protein